MAREALQDMYKLSASDQQESQRWHRADGHSLEKFVLGCEELSTLVPAARKEIGFVERRVLMGISEKQGWIM